MDMDFGGQSPEADSHAIRRAIGKELLLCEGFEGLFSQRAVIGRGDGRFGNALHEGIEKRGIDEISELSVPHGCVWHYEIAIRAPDRLAVDFDAQAFNMAVGQMGGGDIQPFRPRLHLAQGRGTCGVQSFVGW